jgi:peptide-methionine (S)-S-oxide reductase
MTESAIGTETATLGGGCFWCMDAVFSEVRGVLDVTCGYSGGHVPNPSYELVCSDSTGHAEVVQITFDPAVISYSELLEIFFGVHDPTTPNRQGNDVGSQYRSIIFYHSEAQRNTAEELIRRYTREKLFDMPIVTEVRPFEAFYKAEDYHQDYFKNNPNKPYCRFVISPKVSKLRQHFLSKLKVTA